MRPYSVLVSGCILICTLSSAEQNASLKKATTMTAKKSNSIAPSPIALKWLDRTAPVSASGISWGIPWPRGQVAKETSFALSDPAGQSLPVQSWTFAPKRVEGSEVLNPIEENPRLETNGVVQWCLNAIELLELIGDSMPEHNPLWDEFPGEAQ